MRLLLLNPNTTEAVTALMRESAAAVAAPGTEILTATASRGVPYIATRAEAQIGGAIALEMLAEAPRIDAAILAAFGDPGLLGARELFDFPVIGLAEAAMLSACLLGGRFGIVTFAQALVPWYRECVAMHGLEARCAAIRALDGRFASLAEVQAEKEDQLVALAEATVREDGADVLIFAGAPLSGLGPRVRERVPVPVVDQVAAAVKLAEAVVALRPRKATAGTLRRPAPKPSRGLPEALAARIAHTD
ncbi:aspartate/glutamate racemase family protein [Methylobacterium sp. ID0610]|uniref:aspartate/glutamate racemase family protein n=1 Tax=Methylobacterium carpenticola TaxID=3344827 RepID=UPI00369C7B66